MSLRKKNKSQIVALDLKNVSVFLENSWSLRSPFSRKKSGVQSLNNISFSIPQGEIFGVLGRNGAGKTTLLRTIAGIIKPDKGKVRTFGKKACILSINSGFMTDLSGRDNAILGGTVLSGGLKKAKERVEIIKEFSELGEAFERPVSSYSSGMVSRLGFAIAVYNSPDLVLMDEILSVGDVSFKQKSKSKMKEFLQGDRTIMLVSNNPATIAEFSKTAIWMEKGQIVLQGKADLVAKKYGDFSSLHRQFVDEGMNADMAAKKAINQVLSA